MSDGSAVGQRCGGRGRAIAASASSAERHSLYNAAGTARRLGLASLFAIGPSRPGPALRRGVLVAIPVAAALGVELGLGAPSKGAIATGALLAGFPGLDAPAGTRAGWQAAAAPLIGTRRRARRAYRLIRVTRRRGDGSDRRRGRLLLCGLAAAGDCRPLGCAVVGDRTGPLRFSPPRRSER